MATGSFRINKAFHTNSKRFSKNGSRVSSVSFGGRSKQESVDFRAVNFHLEEIKRLQLQIRKRKEFEESANGFRKVLQVLLESRLFNAVILSAILINTLLLMLITWREVQLQYEYYITVIDGFLMAIYVAECIIKMYVKRLEYFNEGWDVLDFIIVCTSIFEMLAPFTLGLGQYNGGGANIFRILRLLRALRSLRVLRTIRFLENIQVILITCIHSFQSLGAIMALMSTFLVIFAVVGRGLFAVKNPKQFGDFWSASFTLVQLLTLDDWFEIFTLMSDKQGYFDIPAFFYLLLYIIIEYFVFLNLFIAVLVDNFQLTLKNKLLKKNEEKERLSNKIKVKDSSHAENVSDEELGAIKLSLLFAADNDDDAIEAETAYAEFMDTAPIVEYDSVEQYYNILASMEKQSHIHHNQWFCHQKIIDMIVDNTDDVIERS